MLDYFQEPGLISWRVKVGAKEAKRVSTVALKLGTAVHTFIETGKKVAKSDSFEYQNCCTAFERFKLENKFEPIQYEKELINEEYGIMGHYDCHAILNNYPTTIDWKTSSKINLKYKIQVNTYTWLDNRQDHSAIVRLDKNLGQYELLHEPYNPELVDVFLAMLKVYRAFEIPNGEGELDDSSNQPAGSITNN